MNKKSVSPVPVVLVAGFLGAGKTTLMRHLILDASTRGLKAAVIVNEFGVTDIDSHILKEADAELMSSIAGGCACCSGQEEFLWTLMDIAERQGDNRPDVILVETSGVADPILMLDSLTVASLLPLVRPASLITVVDHSRFLLTREEVAPLLIRQLQLADHIILNKIDIAYRSEDRGTRVSELVAQLREFNPRAAILPAKACAVNTDTIWMRVLDTLAVKTNEAEVLYGAQEAVHTHYQTVICPLAQPVERLRMEAALQGLSPDVWRVKGFVHLRGEEGVWLLQYSGGRAGGGTYQFTPFPLYADRKQPPASLVFIGPALERDKILRDFGGHTLLAVL